MNGSTRASSVGFFMTSGMVYKSWLSVVYRRLYKNIFYSYYSMYFFALIAVSPPRDLPITVYKHWSIHAFTSFLQRCFNTNISNIMLMHVFHRLIFPLRNRSLLCSCRSAIFPKVIVKNKLEGRTAKLCI